MNYLNIGLVLSNSNKSSPSENDFDLPGRCFNVRVISDVLSRFWYVLNKYFDIKFKWRKCYETVDVM